MDLPDLDAVAREGVFSSADARRELGLTSTQLSSLAKRNACQRLTRGWWAMGLPESRTDRHLLLGRALALHFGERATPSHHTRLILLGLPVLGADLTRAHVTCIGGRQSRRAPAFTLHASVVGSGGPPLPVAVAVVQAGIVGTPLTALAAADAALRMRLCDIDDLHNAMSLLSRHPAVARVKAVLPHADGRHESPGETRLAALFRRIGVAATPQVVIVVDGVTLRVDFALDDHPVVVEFDGRAKYDSPEVLFAEKRREDMLRSQGYEVVRVIWADLADPEKVARLIRAAVLRSRGRRPA